MRFASSAAVSYRCCARCSHHHRHLNGPGCRLIPLTFIRNVGTFAIPNLVADGLIVFTLVSVTVYSCIHISDDGVAPDVTSFNSSNFLLMFGMPRFMHAVLGCCHLLSPGTAVFSFEGIALVLPMYESLSPAQTALFPRNLTSSVFGIVCPVLNHRLCLLIGLACSYSCLSQLPFCRTLLSAVISAQTYFWTCQRPYGQHSCRFIVCFA